jgi:hypothetical protein
MSRPIAAIQQSGCSPSIPPIPDAQSACMHAVRSSAVRMALDPHVVVPIRLQLELKSYIAKSTGTASKFRRFVTAVNPEYEFDWEPSFAPAIPTHSITRR